MKRLFFCIMFLHIYVLSFSASYACFYDGYWSSWKEFSYNWEIYGNWSGFIVYEKSEHPSNYMFKFQIDTSIPPKEEINYNKGKEEKWYVCEGIVEYYVTEDYPTILDVLKAYGFPMERPKTYISTPIAKRTAKATIKTWKRPWNAKRHPNCYNFIFDDIAVGIDQL